MLPHVRIMTSANTTFTLSPQHFTYLLPAGAKVGERVACLAELGAAGQRVIEAQDVVRGDLLALALAPYDADTEFEVVEVAAVERIAAEVSDSGAWGL